MECLSEPSSCSTKRLAMCKGYTHHHYYQHFIEIQSARIPAGKYCSNYMAEIQALVQAASMVRDSSNECQQVVFLCDALSLFQSWKLQLDTNSLVLQKAFIRSHSTNE